MVCEASLFTYDKNKFDMKDNPTHKEDTVKVIQMIPIDTEEGKRLTQQILDRKRPDFTKLVLKHTKSF